MSLTPSATSSNKLCQVCAQPARGNHFGAFVCRACSAFFRRAVHGRCSKLKCAKPVGECAAFKKGRLNCKSCRYKLCLKVGMSAEKFQHDHDLKSMTSQLGGDEKEKKRQWDVAKKVPAEVFFGRPHFTIFMLPNAESSASKTIVNTEYLLEKALEVSRKGIDAANLQQLTNLNNLEKMTFGLQSIFGQNGNSKVRRLEYLDMAATAAVWEDAILNFSRFLTYCDEFQKMEQQSKLDMIKCVWLIFHRYKNTYMTIQNRMKKLCDADLFMVTSDTALHCQEVEVDVSWFSNYSRNDMFYFMDTSEFGFFDDVMAPLLKLQPTPIEQTFMLAQLCFQFVGKKFQGELLEVSERLHETLSNDLHNYYVENLKMPNYSSRLAQLMKVNNIVKNDFIDRNARRDLGRVFDVFKVEFSHPEMFYGFK